MSKPNIIIASDHGGYELKQQLIEYLESKDYNIEDFGTNSNNSVDYPSYGRKVGIAISKAEKNGDNTKGILICGTGIGIGNAACKIKGTRVGICSDHFSAEFTRRHNDANILSIGARVVGYGTAIDLVDTFLTTDFEGERHLERVKLLNQAGEKI